MGDAGFGFTHVSTVRDCSWAWRLIVYGETPET